MSTSPKKNPLLKSSRLRPSANAAASANASIQKQDIPEGAIRKLAEILNSTDLAEIEVKSDKMTIRVRAREASGASFVHTAPVMHAPMGGPTSIVASTKAADAPAADAGLHIVRSPFVGTFYRAPSPTSPNFVEQGQATTKGQSLCIVEAMKLMNEIEADQSGIIEKIFVENGTPVEFNTALFAIRPH